MANNNLSRNTRRRYLTKTDYYKRISSLRFNHPDRVDHRQLMRTQGDDNHKKFVESIQERLAESLSSKEKEIMDLLKSKGLDKSEIDNYMEKWVEVNFWPKPKNYHEVKKQLKKLNKKYGI